MAELFPVGGVMDASPYFDADDPGRTTAFLRRTEQRGVGRHPDGQPKIYRVAFLCTRCGVTGSPTDSDCRGCGARILGLEQPSPLLEGEEHGD
jgi:hypothetical protein